MVRHIVPITNALLDGIDRRHGLAIRVEEHAGQKVWRSGSLPFAPLNAVGFEPTLDTRPEILIDD